MQHHLKEIGRWVARWRTASTPIKPKAVVFSKRTRLKLPELRLHNTSIENGPIYSYLGTMLNHWSKHCERLRGKALKFIMVLKPLLRLSFSLWLKLQLYKIYIRPVMTYSVGFHLKNQHETSGACPEQGDLYKCKIDYQDRTTTFR